MDRVQFCVAPLLLGRPKVAIGGRGAGSTAESPGVANFHYAKLGDDLILTDDIVYAPGECRDWGE